MSDATTCWTERDWYQCETLSVVSAHDMSALVRTDDSGPDSEGIGHYSCGMLVDVTEIEEGSDDE